jgi:histidinol dehydrogenase
MTAVPASVAGVRELSIASPARRHHPAVLEAARLAGVTRVFRAGGAQAVAALAYGTQTIPAVDKIVGPGNVYVQAAKRQVFGQVAIDAEAGPSEVLVIADDSADPEWVAADLLAQAEHEEAASVVLLTPSPELAAAAVGRLGPQLAGTPRERIARAALQSRSLAVVTRDLDEAVGLANRFGPEHLELLTRDAEKLLPRIENAGAVFLGPYAPVPVGDYVAGPSHVLPTGGTSRFFSPLGVEDFLKRMSVIGLGAECLARLGPHVVRLAELEGLHAHARSVALRLGGGRARRAGPGGHNPVS